MLNEHNISTIDYINEIKGKGVNDEKDILDFLYRNKKFFLGVDIKIKYQTILIDEIQDYDSEWVKIIRDFFLDTAGEMVVFGDEAQNIYHRGEIDRASSVVYGFGTWEKLSKSHRVKLDTPLIQMFQEFKSKFMINIDNDLNFDTEYYQNSINYDLLKYETYDEHEGYINYNKIFNLINSFIKDNKLIPNDIAIIASRIGIIQEIDDLFSKQEKTMTMVETLDEISELKKTCLKPLELEYYISKIRRRKKTFFVQNSGLIKISTVHSFKGMEAGTIFYIRNPGGGSFGDEDDAQMVYTAITRSRGNLVVIDNERSRFRSFFENKVNLL